MVECKAHHLEVKQLRVSLVLSNCRKVIVVAEDVVNQNSECECVVQVIVHAWLLDFQGRENLFEIFDPLKERLTLRVVDVVLQMVFARVGWLFVLLLLNLCTFQEDIKVMH